MNYAFNYGYTLNANKCMYILFDRKTHNESIHINNTDIKAASTSKHVGIVLIRSMKCSTAVDDRVSKGRASLFSIMTLRDTPSDINPVIMAGLVQKLSFPTVLYESELNLTMADILKRERFIRLAAKSVSVPVYAYQN